jgi:hypothetical protein
MPTDSAAIEILPPSSTCIAVQEAFAFRFSETVFIRHVASSKDTDAVSEARMTTLFSFLSERNPGNYLSKMTARLPFVSFCLIRYGDGDSCVLQADRVCDEVLRAVNFHPPFAAVAVCSRCGRVGAAWIRSNPRLPSSSPVCQGVRIFLFLFFRFQKYRYGFEHIANYARRQQTTHSSQTAAELFYNCRVLDVAHARPLYSREIGLP